MQIKWYIAYTNNFTPIADYPKTLVVPRHLFKLIVEKLFPGHRYLNLDYFYEEVEPLVEKLVAKVHRLEATIDLERLITFELTIVENTLYVFYSSDYNSGVTSIDFATAGYLFISPEVSELSEKIFATMREKIYHELTMPLTLGSLSPEESEYVTRHIMLGVYEVFFEKRVKKIGARFEQIVVCSMI